MPSKKSTPLKEQPLFTLVDFDSLEVYTNLTTEEMHSTIRAVIYGEHDKMTDVDLICIINQTTGQPHTIDTRVEYELSIDTTQPQYRVKTQSTQTK